MTMECPKCKRDLTEDFQTVYRLGLDDGRKEFAESIKRLEKRFSDALQDERNEFTKRLNRIERIFGHLFAEINVMDIRSPDKINRVYFSRRYMTRLCKLIAKHHLPKKSSEIQKEINRQLGDYMSKEAKLREFLSEIEE